MKKAKAARKSAQGGKKRRRYLVKGTYLNLSALARALRISEQVLIGRFGLDKQDGRTGVLRSLKEKFEPGHKEDVGDSAVFCWALGHFKREI